MADWDWQVFCRNTIDGEVMPRCFGDGGDITYLDWIISAWGWTASVSLLALAVALLFGCLMGILRTTPNRWLVLLGDAWTELFRNIPVLVQVFLWYFVIPELVPALKQIPSFLLVAMIVRSASGQTGWLMLIFGLTAFGWIGYARTLRTMALSLRERDYVTAARYMGVSPIKIIVRHLIPNLGSILILDTVLGVISGINSETAYSFLGLGIKAPDTSLGFLLSQGSSAMLTTPWVILIPSAVLIILCVSMQLIGDGLRDAIDPHSRAAGSADKDDESKEGDAK